MNYYCLHLHSVNLFQQSPDVKSYIIDSLIDDTLFQAGGFWAFDDFPEYILKNSDLKITNEVVDQIQLGVNIQVSKESYNRELPKSLYQLQFLGEAGVDHFGVYNNAYLVVSEWALELLRQTGLTNAEDDLIKESITSYFNQNKQFFWMPEETRKIFIQRFLGKQQ